MCGRYTLYQTEEIEERFDLASKPLIHVNDNYNVAPGQFMPIIIGGEQGNQEELMKWGLIPHWAKDVKIGYKLINARAETAYEKPMWRTAISHYRCLIPAKGFYEWKVLENSKLKVPFFIHPKDQDLFAFAGLWSTWLDVEKREIRSFSIITTTPNKEMSEIHDRMPVILRPNEEKLWLDPSLTERSDIEPLLRPYDNNGLEIYKVTADVNNTRKNEASFINPIVI